MSERINNSITAIVLPIIFLLEGIFLGFTKGKLVLGILIGLSIGLSILFVFLFGILLEKEIEDKEVEKQ